MKIHQLIITCMFPCAWVNPVGIPFLEQGGLWRPCSEILALVYNMRTLYAIGKLRLLGGRPRIQTTDGHAHVYE